MRTGVRHCTALPSESDRYFMKPKTAQAGKERPNTQTVTVYDVQRLLEVGRLLATVVTQEELQQLVSEGDGHKVEVQANGDRIRQCLSSSAPNHDHGILQ